MILTKKADHEAVKDALAKGLSKAKPAAEPKPKPKQWPGTKPGKKPTRTSSQSTSPCLSPFMAHPKATAPGPGHIAAANPAIQPFGIPTNKHQDETLIAVGLLQH